MRLFSRKTTFSKMIISYLMVLVIPLAFSVSLCVKTLEIAKRNVDEANLSVLNNVRDNVNISLSGISNVMRALLVDERVTRLANQTLYAARDYTAMDELQHILALSLLSNTYMDDVLIYFHQSDFVLSSKSYLRHLETMTGYSSIIGLDISEFTKQINSAEDYTLRLVDSEHGVIPFIRAQDSFLNKESAGVTILVRLKSGLLKDLIRSDNCYTFLVDAGGNHLSNERETLFRDGAGWRLESDNRRTQCIETEDLVFQIQYVRFVPPEIYFQNLSPVFLLAFAFLALSLGCGLPLAISTARRSYHPVREIMSLIPHPQKGQESDDYMTIRTSLTSLLQKTEDYEVERENRTIVLRGYLLYRLLNAPGQSESAFLEECRKCGVAFEETSFLMIGIYIENGSNLFFEQNEGINEDMSHFLTVAIANVFREVLAEEYRFFAAEYKDAHYAVVNVNARLDREVVVDEIKKSCLLVADRLDGEFRAIVSVAVSNVHSGHGKIRRCYDEVMEIAQQQGLLKHSAYVTQYNELSSIRQRADPAGHRTASSGKKEGERRVDVQEISAYIDEHYSDPSLTVGALSEHFEMTAANLSLLFKRRLGLPPLEYIQLKRVSEAKRLLDSTQMKVSEIAKNVGYFDSRPLIRAFRRIEGMSPNEYRDRERTE